MTTADKIAALPEMPNPYTGPDDMTINQLRIDTIKALRARLSLALEVLDVIVRRRDHATRITPQFRDGSDGRYRDARLVLEAMRELR